MAVPRHRLLLIRHGELALKSHRVRARLMRTLTRRIEEALERAQVEGLVVQTHARHLVEADDLDGATRAVRRVFGITSMSRATPAPAELTGLQEAAAAYARMHWPQGARSFAIRARRTGSHPYTSQDVAVATGSAVMTAMKQAGVDARVDLGKPDWALSIEVRDDKAYLCHDRIAGPGGLPLSSQGRVVVWLTDEESAVAAWLMMRRGAQIEAFYLPQVTSFKTQGSGPAAGEHSAVRAHEALRDWGATKRLHPVELDEQTIAASGVDDRRMVSLARAALEQGLDLVRRSRASALVTPETREVPWADRLPETHPGGDVPILRPLMGLDPETIRRYRDAVFAVDAQGGARDKVASQAAAP